MASLSKTIEGQNYNGPFPLTAEGVWDYVEANSIGTYILAVEQVTESGTFSADYIGRSDGRLGWRLRDHVEEDLDDVFWFRYCDTADEAYQEEMRLYDALCDTIRNDVKPARP